MNKETLSTYFPLVDLQPYTLRVQAVSISQLSIWPWNLYLAFFNTTVNILTIVIAMGCTEMREFSSTIESMVGERGC